MHCIYQFSYLICMNFYCLLRFVRSKNVALVNRQESILSASVSHNYYLRNKYYSIVVFYKSLIRKYYATCLFYSKKCLHLLIYKITFHFNYLQLHKLVNIRHSEDECEHISIIHLFLICFSIHLVMYINVKIVKKSIKMSYI